MDTEKVAQSGNSTIKRKFLAKLIELKESYDLSDASRIREKWHPRPRTIIQWEPEP